MNIFSFPQTDTVVSCPYSRLGNVSLPVENLVARQEANFEEGHRGDSEGNGCRLPQRRKEMWRERKKESNSRCMGSVNDVIRNSVAFEKFS